MRDKERGEGSFSDKVEEGRKQRDERTIKSDSRQAGSSVSGEERRGERDCGVK